MQHNNDILNSFHIIYVQQLHSLLVGFGDEGNGNGEGRVQAEHPAQGQAHFAQERHHVREHGGEPLEREQHRGHHIGPGVNRVQMDHVKLAAYGLAQFFAHVQGVQPQRPHDERERVQHYVRQCYVRFFIFNHENR